MQAGKMRHRLEMLRPEGVSDSFGSKSPTFTPAGTCRAERVKMRGFASSEAGEMFADYRTEWNVRDAHPVAEHWRVRQLGGDLYTVTNVIPNRERGMKTLICERVNP